MRFGFTLLVLFVSPAFVHAASVSLSPSSGTYEVGDRFSVRVLVSSTDQLMNAVSSDISFSPSRLQLVSILQSSSIIDFWAQAPTFSNQSGKASFDGIILSGYQGGSGELVTLVFRAAGIGSTTVEIPVGSVLAHDGLGTSIPSTFGKANFDIVETGVAPPPPVVVPLAVPRISSPTHPDENKWYADKNPIFTWPLPSDVIDVKVFVTREPTPEFDGFQGLIDRYVLPDVQEGTQYLHVVFETEEGFSETVSFRFNVDSEPPEQVVIEEVYRSYRDNRRAEFSITSEDKTSGISHYRISIDGAHVEDWVDDGTHKYQTPSLWYGNHTLTVEAVDQAGNTTAASFVFSIAYPLLLAIIFLLAVIALLLLTLIVLVYRSYSLAKRKDMKKRLKK